MNKKFAQVFLNPLTLFHWEPRSNPPQSPENLAPEILLNFLCSLRACSDMSTLYERYREIGGEEQSTPLFFEEPEIKENLYEPLRQAKTNYILGNYVGSIALCGIVGEKVAILIHTINTPDKIKREDFEKQYQPIRIALLLESNLITEESAKDFHYIHQTRIPYWHHWNSPEEDTAGRAIQAYAAATRVVGNAMGIIFAEGIPNARPEFVKYLEDRGAIANNKRNDTDEQKDD